LVLHCRDNRALIAPEAGDERVSRRESGEM
jgi:hypothetical protein